MQSHRKGLPVPLFFTLIFMLIALSGFFLACGDEARRDAEKAGQRVDRTPANVIAMPDAFRNVAHKCDGYGHRVYSNSTGDSGTGAELFVINDPSCGEDNR